MKNQKLDKNNLLLVIRGFAANLKPLTQNSKLLNEKGIALLLVMVLSAIALGMMAGLIYMITSGTQISGMEKRHKIALDAGMGGGEVSYQVIAARGNLLDAALTGPLSLAINTPIACGTLAATVCTDIGNYTGLAAKLNLPTSCWSGCDTSLTTGPGNNDMTFILGSYTVFGKIIDTAVGNSGGDEGLLTKGVVNASGEITPMSIPYLYTIEIDAEATVNPSKRAKLSILYQY
ncbi:MAG: hypothetical protein WA240_15890 [Nitrospirota bacterium]